MTYLIIVIDENECKIDIIKTDKGAILKTIINETIYSVGMYNKDLDALDRLKSTYRYIYADVYEEELFISLFPDFGEHMHIAMPPRLKNICGDECDQYREVIYGHNQLSYYKKDYNLRNDVDIFYSDNDQKNIFMVEKTNNGTIVSTRYNDNLFMTRILDKDLEEFTFFMRLMIESTTYDDSIEIYFTKDDCVYTYVKLFKTDILDEDQYSPLITL